jgi:hypothetical protein
MRPSSPIRGTIPIQGILFIRSVKRFLPNEGLIVTVRGRGSVVTSHDGRSGDARVS